MSKFGGDKGHNSTTQQSLNRKEGAPPSRPCVGCVGPSSSPSSLAVGSTMRDRSLLCVVLMGFLTAAFVFAWTSEVFPTSAMQYTLHERAGGDDPLAEAFLASVSARMRTGVQHTLHSFPQLKEFINKRQEEVERKLRDQLLKLATEAEEQVQQSKLALEFPYNRINDPSSPHHLTVILPFRDREKNLEKMSNPSLSTYPAWSVINIFPLFLPALLWVGMWWGSTTPSRISDSTGAQLSYRCLRPPWRWQVLQQRDDM